MEQGTTRAKEHGKEAPNADTTSPFAALHSQTISVQHILHPYIINDDDILPSRSLHTALFHMRKAVETIAMMVDLQERSTSPTLLRIEHRIAGSRDVLAWLRAQTSLLNDVTNTDVLYFHTDQREVAGLGIALRAPGGSLWPHVLPPRAVWYGGARFDVNATIDDEDWRPFWSSQYPDSYWIVPIIELVHRQPNDEVTLAVHCQMDPAAMMVVQRLLEQVHGSSAPQTAAPLPPILSRDGSPVDVYEDAVAAAVEALESPENRLTKVVLARSQTLRFGRRFRALDVVARSKYCSNGDDGMLFLLQPAASTAFVGCTPETLFAMNQHNLTTEALAGTRPRGTSESDDNELFRDLLSSPKDRRENRLTADFVENVLESVSESCGSKWSSTFGVRRLRHLQHICARYTVPLGKSTESKWDIALSLLQSLHPTPAVGGLPKATAMEMIREREGIDRGMYAGPVGFIGSEESCLGVAIRSALCINTESTTSLKVYAGSGLVEGSTLLGEWTEINSKLAVMSSLFPQSPVSLRSAPTPNVAWATAFCEELVRNGITQFYICPGSRSTPLTIALAKMQVQCISVHDERAAGFRAVGYARGTGRPAAVVTSSGTAVANLYPAAVEAGTDGLPVLLLTADRPYENRAMGANQAIDQVKIFSGNYIRWFRDVLPPTDDVPVSVALSDACQAVTLSNELRGPVHLNLQFRENLAPDSGPIRNDNRLGSDTRFDGERFTDVAGFKRWSEEGGPWMIPYRDNGISTHAIHDLASLIEKSKRGIIVVGNLRKSTDGAELEESGYLQIISDFARAIGFPIVAGVQSARLRFTSPAVVPFAEHILKNRHVSENLQPDLVIQLGAPLISTAVPHVISSSMKTAQGTAHHVLIHSHFSTERADPDSTVTHRISGSFKSILPGTMELLADRGSLAVCGSDLTSLVALGRKLAPVVKDIVSVSSRIETEGSNETSLTEPDLMVAFSELMEKSTTDVALFLSNSMPIRDAESFLYPYNAAPESRPARLHSVESNRGASGIDGIISSALGFSEAAKLCTTLIVGDLASLHDIGSLHSVSNTAPKSHPLTTIIVNNDGGGIFSFLPVARFGETVRFDEFFGTPTKGFSFTAGAQAFGLIAYSAASREEFLGRYTDATQLQQHSVIEAQVVGRQENVAVHRRISEAVDSLISEHIGLNFAGQGDSVQSRVHIETAPQETDENAKVLVLLHGWMGDTHEWDTINVDLQEKIGSGWKIMAVDLPGHGLSPRVESSDKQRLQSSLGINPDVDHPLAINEMADAILSTLVDHGVQKVHGMVGYSAGGRVGLAMKKLSLEHNVYDIVDEETSLVLIGAYPGNVTLDSSESQNIERHRLDQSLARELDAACSKCELSESTVDKEGLFSDFLYKWYDKELWGKLNESEDFANMIKRRVRTLSRRGRDIASFLSRGSSSDPNAWTCLQAEKTLFVAGSLDKKYQAIGKALFELEKAQYIEVDACGHALLTEAPKQVAQHISNFLNGVEDVGVEPPKQENTEVVTSISRETAGTEITESVATGSTKPLWTQTIDTSTAIEALEVTQFSIPLVDPNVKGQQPLGIGWGKQAHVGNTVNNELRTGFVVQLECRNGLYVGLGEVSPITGVHSESIEQVQNQLEDIRSSLSKVGTDDAIEFDPEEAVKMHGGVSRIVDDIVQRSNISTLFPTVRSGLEMAIISLSSQLAGLPLHQVMVQETTGSPRNNLPLNGLITRTSSLRSPSVASNARTFPSMKVKVGHQDMEHDKSAILRAYQLADRTTGRIRADANRAWNESQAIEFATALEALDLHALEKLEFIEEPLQKVLNKDGSWNFSEQIAALERSYFQTGIAYALDESLAELAESHNGEYELIEEEMRETFRSNTHGCAAVVLKPSVLGVELSLRMAKFVRSQLGIGAVFSSCYESGIGLAHISLLAHAADQVHSKAQLFPHGVGTFTMLSDDTLIPAFETYVGRTGILQIAPLSRAIYGLSLADINESRTSEPTPQSLDDYESATATNKSGKEISVVASMQLPFSQETAAARFTDLPTISRWSPWVSNVEYQGVS